MTQRRPSRLFDRSPKMRGRGSRTFLAVCGLVVLSAALRLQGLDTISLCHYDEGVYVSSGLRMTSGEVTDFAFGQALHAPPLYPWLLSVAFRILNTPWPNVGPYVSALLGIATVPLVYAMARTVTTTSHALLAGLLLACSDLHIAFSRMALTDVPLTFWFVAAMWLFFAAPALLVGRPRPWLRSIGLGIVGGLLVGAAWNTKYNGWMPLGIAYVAAAWVWLHQRATRSRTFTPVEWKCLVTMMAVATGVAAVLYWPWYALVERSYPGGYAAITAHHRTYVNSPLEWPANAWRLLQCFPAFRHAGWLVLVNLGIVAIVWFTRGARRIVPLVAVVVLAMVIGTDAVCFVFAVVSLVKRLRSGTWQDAMPACWLLAFVCLVPLYTPYLRLLLPALPVVVILATNEFMPWISGTAKESTDGEFHAQRRVGRWGAVGSHAGLGLIGCTLFALTGNHFEAMPSQGLWGRWNCRAAYQAFASALDQATPSDAAVILQGQPPFSLYAPRQSVVIGNEPFWVATEGIPLDRSTYLALDFRVIHEPDPTARDAVRSRLTALQPIFSVPYDANIVTLLDYLTPRQVAQKLKQQQAEDERWIDAAGRAVLVPPALDAMRRDVIVLYRVNLEAIRAAR